MIRSHGASEADFLVAPHGLQHICRPVIMERFHKVGCCSPNVTKMHEMDLLPLTKETNGCRDVRTHSGNGSLTEGNAIPVTGNQFEPTMEGINAGEDSGNAPNR